MGIPEHRMRVRVVLDNTYWPKSELKVLAPKNDPGVDGTATTRLLTKIISDGKHLSGAFQICPS